jgi:hypothetical protein
VTHDAVFADRVGVTRRWALADGKLHEG